MPTVCWRACRDRPRFRRLLTGIIAVDSLRKRSTSAVRSLNGESVITRDGVWIGREWLRVSRDKDVHAGVIGREKEMRALRDAVAAAEQQREAAAG